MKNEKEPKTNEKQPEESVIEVSEDNGKIDAQAPVAAEGTAEEAAEGAYKALFEQMKATNEELAAANKSLQDQIGILIRNGSTVTARNEDEANREPKEPYASLADLGSEIGKRDYKSHNVTQKE